MQVYDTIVKKNGSITYRRDKTFIKKDDVPENVLEVLKPGRVVDENGNVLVYEKSDEQIEKEQKDEDKPIEQSTTESDEDADEDSPEEPEETQAKEEPSPDGPFKSRVPQSTTGMGFPRKNGKTVDIFDGETPHTQSKFIGGHIVPLSQKSFDTKSDAQIEARLKELGIKVVDYNKYEVSEGDTFSEESDDGLSEDK